jgi:DNA polymerase
MIQIAVENDYGAWREAARGLIRSRVEPHEILWLPPGHSGLFDTKEFGSDGEESFRVPPEFLKIAEAAACYDDAERWPLLYRVLYRIVFENRELLQIESDPDVRSLRLMEKAVGRDVHKFHAFVRFRHIDCGGKEIYVAWHEPQHFTVERSAPFFARRFGTMNFSILTPKGCAHWDLEKLTFSPAATRDLAPVGDETEEFWLLYYRSIFNPFRLKVKAMKKELPVRHWRTLPEAVLIPELIRGSYETE